MRKQKGKNILTQSEMEIMNIVWASGRDITVRDVLEQMPEPRPAYTTVGTFMKILTEKGALEAKKHEGDGKTLYYAPLLGKVEYKKRFLELIKRQLFDGSIKSLVSFFVEEEEISREELIEYLEELKSLTPASPKGEELLREINSVQ